MAPPLLTFQRLKGFCCQFSRYMRIYRKIQILYLSCESIDEKLSSVNSTKQSQHGKIRMLKYEYYMTAVWDQLYMMPYQSKIHSNIKLAANLDQTLTNDMQFLLRNTLFTLSVEILLLYLLVKNQKERINIHLLHSKLCNINLDVSQLNKIQHPISFILDFNYSLGGNCEQPLFRYHTVGLWMFFFPAFLCQS